MTIKLLELHKRFSRVISDPVTGETTNGTILTATQRDDYINRGIHTLQELIYSAYGIEEVQRILSSQIKTATIAYSSGFALPSDDNAMPLSLDDGTNLYRHYPNRRILVLGLNADIPAYAIEGTAIYPYTTSGLKVAGTVYYSYVIKDEGENDKTDVVISTNLFDIVVFLAASQFSADTGNTQDVDLFMNQVKLLLQGLKHE
jgi:hypothetical protein